MASAGAAGARPSEVAERMSLLSLTESASLTTLGAAKGGAAARYAGAGSAAGGGRYGGGAKAATSAGDRQVGGAVAVGAAAAAALPGGADQGPLARGVGMTLGEGKVGPRAHAVALSTATLTGK